MPVRHKLDAELRDLWSRRSNGLDEAGWTRLFQIVGIVLSNYRPRELAGLSEDRGEYVQDFFLEKVFRADLLTRCDHVGALRLYYLNYLRDEIRTKKSRAKFEVENQNDPDNDSPTPTDRAPANDDNEDCLVQLEQSGFLPSKVAESATQWLESNEEWVRLFVAFSNCPDAELSVPLVHLARLKGIKSQAYKAEKLGFNWGGGDPKNFRETMIGRWISESVGIEITSENVLLIHGALKILCLQALLWAEQQEVAL